MIWVPPLVWLLMRVRLHEQQLFKTCLWLSFLFTSPKYDQVLLWSQTYVSVSVWAIEGKYKISSTPWHTHISTHLAFYDRNMQFHLGLMLPLWGRICKWNTNELKVFSLWELINQGAPLLHIYIFLKSSQGSPVTNYSAFPGQLHWTSAPLSSSEHHTCIFAPFIFSRVLQAKGSSSERGYKRKQGKSENEGGGRNRRQNREKDFFKKWSTEKDKLEAYRW